MQCLDTLKPVACKPDGPRDDCWYPSIDDRVCYNCAQDKSTGDTSVYTTEEEFNTCVACTKGNPAAAGWCDRCSQPYLSTSWPTPTPANRYLRAQCYECASNHRKEPSTSSQDCTNCFSSLVTSFAQREQCLSCIFNRDNQRRGMCAACGEEMGCTTFAERQQCMQCLTEDHNSHEDDCRCHKRAQLGPVVEAVTDANGHISYIDNGLVDGDDNHGAS